MAANYTVPPIIGQLRLNNGRVATFYETDRAGYERSLASGATPVTPNPPDTTIVDGKEVATTADIPPPVDTVTTGESQATPQPATGPTQPGPTSARDDAPTQAPTQGGVGAGTSSNAAQSRGSDNNPGPNTATTQQVLNVFSTNVNGLIQAQPNQLDQYASYTYGISWYLLSEQQIRTMAKEQKANVAGWQLLMQSGGAPIAGRSPAFPVDYYMDDLEIDTRFPGGGTNMAVSATQIRFKVTEPNGISLLENLFNACKAVDTNSKTKNYYSAPYCLVIQFYGYDSNGNLVAPAKGSASGTYGQAAVITKYYPFVLTDISFRVANRAVEYEIKGMPIPHYYRGTDRGTILKNITLTGQTVKQLLIGSPLGATNNSTAGERVTTPTPPPTPNPTVSVNDYTVNAGVNVNGNFTGETFNPNAVVAP